jgi:hypothetical protein
MILGAIDVGDDDALDCGRGGDALDASPVGEVGEQAGHLVTVERFRATADVDRLSRVTTWAGTSPMRASRSATLRNEPPNQTC